MVCHMYIISDLMDLYKMWAVSHIFTRELGGEGVGGVGRMVNISPFSHIYNMHIFRASLD